MAEVSSNCKRASEKVIENELTCFICGKQYTDPRLLSCFHYFCKLCIQNSCPVPEPGRCFICTCPTCGKKTDLPESDAGKLNCAYFVKQKEELCILLRQVEEGKDVACSSCESCEKSVAYCFNCTTFICNSCRDMHTVKKVKKFKDHKIVTLDEIRHGVDSWSNIQIPKYCNFHSTDVDKKPLEYFCVACEEVVC